MLKSRLLRRTLAAIFIVAGALLMWLAPGATFTSFSLTGLVLLLVGIVVELIGIVLEQRDAQRSK